MCLNVKGYFFSSASGNSLKCHPSSQLSCEGEPLPTLSVDATMLQECLASDVQDILSAEIFLSTVLSSSAMGGVRLLLLEISLATFEGISICCGRAESRSNRFDNRARSIILDSGIEKIDIV